MKAHTTTSGKATDQLVALLIIPSLKLSKNLLTLTTALLVVQRFKNYNYLPPRDRYTKDAKYNFPTAF